MSLEQSAAAVGSTVAEQLLQNGASEVVVTKEAADVKAMVSPVRPHTSPLKGDKQTVLVANISAERNRMPFILGFYNYLLRHLPSVGFFVPVAANPYPNSTIPDRHVELLSKLYDGNDPSKMIAITEAEAAKMVAAGKTSDFLDKVYNSYAGYIADKDFCLVEGPGAILGGNELDAHVADALSTPVLMTICGQAHWRADDYFNLATLKAEMFRNHKVDVLGVALTRVAGPNYQAIIDELKERFAKAGLGFVGGLPDDPVLTSVRLDEVITKLDAKVLFGHGILDQEFGTVVVGTQRPEEVLDALETASSRPLLVTSMDRLDILLCVTAAQASVNFPSIAAVLLTTTNDKRPYSMDSVTRVYQGIEDGGQLKNHLMPILSVDMSLYDVVRALGGKKRAIILPTSVQKIRRSKDLFDQHIDGKIIKDWLNTHPRDPTRMTPKMFQYNIKSKCLATPQRIVLPESNDKRVLAAAAEVTQRGLAHVILLGDPVVVQADANKLGLDISKCEIVNPQVTGDDLEKYLNAFLASRGSKAPPRQSAIDQILGDVNLFGVLMVHLDEADGMVSGALHTTAATVRPAMQVLKAEGGSRKLVSSIFFMCLPDKVLAYGDCAVNPNPSAQDLAAIAITSAETAKAFGIEPRVAMLSYSTLTSGSGPDVQKVTEAVSILKKTLEPEVAPYFCGPLQYDAAIDPVIAEVKVKKDSQVAGKATVLIFPDLNTGNNCYKAVQQATGAIAMGPIMQGLSKPVNDLSRGCTVDDIVNTICVTSVQAMQARKASS